MKLRCVSNNGYENNLGVGKEYKIVDIQEGIFEGRYYIIGIGNNNKEFTCYYWRFDIDEDTVKNTLKRKPN